MVLTVRQLSFISSILCYRFMSRLADFDYTSDAGGRCNAPLVGAERWMLANLDKQAASVVIELFKTNQDELAFKQLIHLGLPYVEHKIPVSTEPTHG